MTTTNDKLNIVIHDDHVNATIYNETQLVEVVEKSQLINATCLYIRYMSPGYYNSIEYPKNIFDSLHNLVSLNLSDAGLSQLPDNIFMGLHSLENLMISGEYTELYGFYKKSFAGLTNLKKLNLTMYLRNTSKDKIPNNLFSPLINLRELTICTNNNSCANPEKIKSFPKKLFFPLVNLKILIFRCCAVQKFYPNAFKSLKKLKELTFHSSKIASFPRRLLLPLCSLKKFNIGYNRMPSLPKNIFTRQMNLKKISFYNIDLDILDETIFEPLENLKVLALTQTKLHDLPINIFAPLKHLETLIFDFNGNNTFNYEMIKPLTKLTLLSLKGNNITALPHDCFNSLENLLILDLARNCFENFPEDIFDSLTQLIKLDLSYNKLTTMPKKLIENLVNLIEFNLNDNNITEIADDFFESLTNLQNLYLGTNKLTRLPTSILYCRQLEYFDYSNNEITLDIRFQRFIEAMENYENHDIFKDRQNVHASSIQTSTRESINALFKDPRDCPKDDIIKECLTWDISCLPDLLTYLDDTDVHSTLLVSFYDVFAKVFGRIMKHPNKMDIISRLDEELKESECKCFTGRLTRLVNCLVGFYDDIVISISNSERISAIILSTLDGREMDDELRKVCVDKLKAIDIVDEEIDKWLP